MKPLKLQPATQISTLWRISVHAALDGKGAFRGGGRWNTPGHAVVYFAESPAGAMLEVLAHLPLAESDLPESFTLLRVEFAAEIKTTDLDVVESSSWQSDSSITQGIGDAWLESSSSALARVPSIIMPHTWNVLLNPSHPESARVQVAVASQHLYDPRLLRVRSR